MRSFQCTVSFGVNVEPETAEDTGGLPRAPDVPLSLFSNPSRRQGGPGFLWSSAFAFRGALCLNVLGTSPFSTVYRKWDVGWGYSDSEKRAFLKMRPVLSTRQGLLAAAAGLASLKTGRSARLALMHAGITCLGIARAFLEHWGYTVSANTAMAQSGV